LVSKISNMLSGVNNTNIVATCDSTCALTDDNKVDNYVVHAVETNDMSLCIIDNISQDDKNGQSHWYFY